MVAVCPAAAKFSTGVTSTYELTTFGNILKLPSEGLAYSSKRNSTAFDKVPQLKCMECLERGKEGERQETGSGKRRAGREEEKEGEGGE